MFNKHTLVRICRLALISLTLNLGVIIGMAWIFKFLWNTTIAGFENLHAIGYIRAFGVLAASKVLGMVLKGVQLNASLED